MRKDIVLGVFLAVNLCALSAQQETQPSSNLSLDFANAGLAAINSIRQCRGTMFFTEGGIAVPPDTQKTIDTAENSARTGPERAVVHLLRALFLARLNTNMSRLVVSMFPDSTGCRDHLTRQATADRAVTESETIQRRCRIALRVLLRRRLYLGTPEECENLPPWDPALLPGPESEDR